MCTLLMRIDMKVSRERVLDVIKRRIAEGNSLLFDDIAAEIGCERTTVYRAVRDLKAAGRLRQIRRGQRFVEAKYELPDTES